MPPRALFLPGDVPLLPTGEPVARAASVALLLQQPGDNIHHQLQEALWLHKVARLHLLPEGATVWLVRTKHGAMECAFNRPNDCVLLDENPRAPLARLFFSVALAALPEAVEQPPRTAF